MSERESENRHEDKEVEGNSLPASVRSEFKFSFSKIIYCKSWMWLDGVESLFHMKKVVNQTDKYSAVCSALLYSVSRLLLVIMDRMSAGKPSKLPFLRNLHPLFINEWSL